VTEPAGWRRTPALPALRERLRSEQPSRRWSELALTCAMVADRDVRTSRERLAELARRQTHSRYSV
jgi:hypothetical protein